MIEFIAGFYTKRNAVTNDNKANPLDQGLAFMHKLFFLVCGFYFARLMKLFVAIDEP